MRAAVFYGRGDIRVEDVAVREPGPDEVRVRVAAVGVCGTDASEFSAGPKMFPIEHTHPVSGHRGPMIPGHEFSGYVEAIGTNVTSLGLGDLVASGAVLPCGTCELCRTGRPNLCTRTATVGLHRDGALAETVVLPARGLVRAGPYGVTADAAALAQPMAIAVHAMRRGSPAKGSSAIVIGCGGIGAFLVFALAREDVRVTAVDVSQARLAIAARLGASATIAAWEILAPAPLVFEVSGTQAGLDAAVAAVATAGRVVSVGIAKGAATYDARRVTLNEIEIVGSNALDVRTDVTRALELLALDHGVWSLVAPRAVPLSEAVDKGIGALSEGRASAIKVLIDPSIARERETVF
ncbi:MAG TPA: alcohol dehydrogenase catalytic domain-containing protein [Candidatus Lustribacter sp.]